MGYQVVERRQPARASRSSRTSSTSSPTWSPSKRQAYVGQSAFAHKGGVHVAAVQRNPETYEHIDPGVVGNQQRVLVSDLSGRANILYKAKQFGVDLESLDGHVRQPGRGGEGSRARAVSSSRAPRRRWSCACSACSARLPRYFELDPVPRRRREGLHAPASSTSRALCRCGRTNAIEHDPASAWAAVMLAGPNGEIEHTAAEGNGPVNALDKALRRALRSLLSARRGGAAARLQGARARRRPRAARASVRVLIESGDGARALGHRRGVAQRHRGELAGARRQLRVQAVQGPARQGKRRAQGGAQARRLGCGDGALSGVEPRASCEPRGSLDSRGGAAMLPTSAMIYLDHNATTPLDPAVAAAMAALPEEGLRQSVERLRRRTRGARAAGAGAP